MIYSCGGDKLKEPSGNERNVILFRAHDIQVDVSGLWVDIEWTLSGNCHSMRKSFIEVLTAISIFRKYYNLERGT